MTAMSNEDVALITEDFDGLSVSVFKPVRPIVCGPWQFEEEHVASYLWRNFLTEQTAILSGQVYDERRWLHLSIAGRGRMPTYRDLFAAKESFIGLDERAFQVFPPKAEHYNLHPYCLHLWSPVGFNPLPDFTYGGRGI